MGGRGIGAQCAKTPLLRGFPIPQRRIEVKKYVGDSMEQGHRKKLRQQGRGKPTSKLSGVGAGSGYGRGEHHG